MTQTTLTCVCVAFQFRTVSVDCMVGRFLGQLHGAGKLEEIQISAPTPMLDLSPCMLFDGATSCLVSHVLSGCFHKELVVT